MKEANFKFLASTVPDIWTGSKDFKITLRNPLMAPLAQFFIFFFSAPRCPSACQIWSLHYSWLVGAGCKSLCPVINRSRDMRGCQNSKSRSRDPMTTCNDLIRQPDSVGTALSFTAVLFSNPLFSAVARRTPIKSIREVGSQVKLQNVTQRSRPPLL